MNETETPALKLAWIVGPNGGVATDRWGSQKDVHPNLV